MKLFLYGLAIAFIVLKLIGFIDWNWFLVLLPLWINILGIIFSIFYYAYQQAKKDEAKRIANERIDKIVEATGKSRFQIKLDEAIQKQRSEVKQ